MNFSLEMYKKDLIVILVYQLKFFKAVVSGALAMGIDVGHFHNHVCCHPILSQSAPYKV